MFTKTFTILAAALLASAVPAMKPTPAAAAQATLFTSCTVPNTVALTFDDGPYIYEKVISDLLTKHGAKGTFFVNGDNYDCIYDETIVENLRYTFNAGHQIASHTWSHPNLNKLSAAQMTQELTKLDTAFLKILGMKTSFLRPPYGDYNTAVLQTALQQGKPNVVTWDFDSGDSVGESFQNSEKDYSKVIAQHPSTLLALNHETEKNTALNLTEYAITHLQAAGYKLVTVAECLGMKPYTATTSFGTRDSSWKC